MKPDDEFGEFRDVDERLSALSPPTAAGDVDLRAAATVTTTTTVPTEAIPLIAANPIVHSVVPNQVNGTDATKDGSVHETLKAELVQLIAKALVDPRTPVASKQGIQLILKYKYFFL